MNDLLAVREWEMHAHGHDKLKIVFNQAFDQINQF